MNREELLAAFDRQLRMGVRPDGAGDRVERSGRVIRHISRGDGWTGIAWSDLDPATADAEIAAQVAYFTSLGRPFEWKLYGHDRPEDLPGRLRAAGFVPEPGETLMVAEIARLPAAVTLPAGVRLRPVTGPADVDLMAAVHERAFGTDSGRLRSMLLALLAETPGRMAAVVAMAGEEPVSAARLDLPPGTEFAGLWSGGTVPAWRGRGLYRALVGYRARVAAEHGYRYLQVDASDDSRPILERLGFLPLTTTTPYLYEP